jgi:hypothetical protein
MPDALQPGRLGRRLAQIVVVAALVAVVVATFPGLGQVRRHLAHAQPGWLIVAVAAELSSALSYVACLRAVFCRRRRACARRLGAPPRRHVDYSHRAARSASFC